MLRGIAPRGAGGTCWLMRAVNNAWANRPARVGVERAVPVGRLRKTGESYVVEGCSGAGRDDRSGSWDGPPGAGAAGCGGFSRRLFAGHYRGENQRATAVSGGRTGPRG